MSQSTVTTIATTINEASSQTLKFGTTDYVVFMLLLTSSAAIGAYFGFFSKAKNTTDEYLMGGKRMKTWPIAISLVASQLSGIAIMTLPSESYSFGVNYLFLVLAVIPAIPALIYIVVPVFYENGLTNCYEYLELRFNKLTRQLVTASFLLHIILMIPLYMFVPALAFSQVSGFNIHLINGVTSSICIFYTMLGGIKAVVWTDVVQGCIMFLSVIMVGVFGIAKVGGLGKVLQLADEGGRMNFDFSFDPRIRSTVWNMFIASTVMWTGHVGFNQSCVQRIVSLPSVSQAKKSLILTGCGIMLIMFWNFFTGIIMFARYFGCDPIAAGRVSKLDKMMPFFVQDVVGHISGMPGVFISCVFSAALSTLSANLNSLAGVVYFDFIKPRINHTEARANTIMKIIVVLMGVYAMLGGFVVQNFKSILQATLTISGISTGAIVGVFLLGMFVPRVNGKVAATSIAFSVSVMIIIIVNMQMRIRSGEVKYTPLPNTLDQCEARDLLWIYNGTNQAISMPTVTTPLTTSTEEPKVTTAFGSNRDFSFVEISFYTYKAFGAALVFLCAIPLSYIWRQDRTEKQNPKLYSPIIRSFLKHQETELDDLTLKVPLTNGAHETKIDITEKSNNFCPKSAEKQLALKDELTDNDKINKVKLTN